MRHRQRSANGTASSHSRVSVGPLRRMMTPLRMMSRSSFPAGPRRLFCQILESRLQYTRFTVLSVASASEAQPRIRPSRGLRTAVRATGRRSLTMRRRRGSHQAMQPVSSVSCGKAGAGSCQPQNPDGLYHRATGLGRPGLLGASLATIQYPPPLSRTQVCRHRPRIREIGAFGASATGRMCTGAASWFNGKPHLVLCC